MQTIARTDSIAARKPAEAAITAPLAERRDAERADAVGIALSLLCMLHCAIFFLGPLILPFAAVEEHIHGQSHLWFAIAVSMVSILAFGRGYCSHRSLEVLSRAGVGLGLLFLGLIVEEHSLICSILLTLLGSILLVATHFLNRRLKSASCGCCHLNQ